MSQEYKIPVWEINGLRLELDFDDADAMERYSRAFDKMAETAKNPPKDGTRKDGIEYYCKAFYVLYDDIFGKGTGEKIFKGKRIVHLCDEVFDSFISFVNVNIAASDIRIKNITNKYKKNPSAKPRNHKGQKNRKKQYN